MDDTKRPSLEEFVRLKGGKRVISRVLIANNGIAAVKAIRSIKKWSYETFANDKAVKFIVMATPEDLKANAEYIHLADEYVAVPGGANCNNYANVTLITNTAQNVGAHAVWAGWGHASENPKLPDALAETGITWIGPPSSAMRALGDKIGSTIIAQTAGVPCMPWSGDGIEVNYQEGGIPNDVYARACVSDAKHAREVATRVGYPIMIKASEGGGGKGIRKADSENDDIEMLFSQVQGEVPGSPIFLMRLSPICRHLEVQLLGDEYGNAIAIFGRDCSVQRRHQKIIEEGPVLAAPPAMWKHMEQSAVALAKEVGYVGAGTVEYLYTSDGEYYFLELNPRLQVEHPVTELISGVNLPTCQLLVAMGLPMSSIACIREMYGQCPDDVTPIDYDNTEPRTLPGHVIACRITAENPDAGFQPTSGSITELTFRSLPSVWGYFSINSNGNVHEFSDSQFGHVFAHGATRELARVNMACALRDLSIRGDIRTTVEYLRVVLESKDFVTNNITTTWLERLLQDPTVTTAKNKPPAHISVCLGALFRSYHTYESHKQAIMTELNRGALPSAQLYSNLVKNNMSLIYENVKYQFCITSMGPDSFGICSADWSACATVSMLSDGGLLILLDGQKYVAYGQEFPSGLRLTVAGQTILFEQEYDPTRLVSPMQGKLVRWLIADEAHVDKGAPYVEVEVMKMFLSLKAPEPGCIRTIKPAGSVIEAGDLLGTMMLDFPDTVRRANVFDGCFPQMGPPTPVGTSESNLLNEGLRTLSWLLDGYQLVDGSMEKIFTQTMSCLRSSMLPLHQFNDVFSTITAKIPEELAASISEITAGYAAAANKHRFYWEPADDFPVSDLQNAIDSCLSKLDAGARVALSQTLADSGLDAVLTAYRQGNHFYAATVLTGLLEAF
jgi:biotin carboxylase